MEKILEIHGTYIILPRADDSLANSLTEQLGGLGEIRNAREEQSKLAPSIRFQAVETDLPIHRKGEHPGTRIGYASETRRTTIYYNPELPHSSLIGWTEYLMAWPNKTKVHASAVSDGEVSYVFTAPPNTGKTTLVMELVKSGWNFMSDDWALIDDAGLVYSYPKNVRVFDYNLAFDKDWCSKLYGMRAPAMNLWMRLRVAMKRRLIAWLPHRLLRYATERLLSRPVFELPPHELPGEMPEHGLPLGGIFWLQRGNYDSIRIEPMTRDSLVSRICHTYEYEFSDYRKMCHSQGMMGDLDLPSVATDSEKHVRAIVESAIQGLEPTRILIPVTTRPSELAEAFDEIRASLSTRKYG